MENKIVSKLGNFKNHELVEAMLYGFVKGQFPSRVECFRECVDTDIDDGEIEVPEDIAKSFDYWNSMTMNFALAEAKYRCHFGDEAMQMVECFYDQLNKLQYIEPSFEERCLMIAKKALIEGYNSYVGYTKPEDKQAQKWYTGILKGQDNVINEVNNILNNG